MALVGMHSTSMFHMFKLRISGSFIRGISQRSKVNHGHLDGMLGAVTADRFELRPCVWNELSSITIVACGRLRNAQSLATLYPRQCSKCHA
eukprot:125841-Chlamydomonas_euryale.AAC.3